jgi:hypothetical protein
VTVSKQLTIRGEDGAILMPGGDGGYTTSLFSGDQSPRRLSARQV